MARDVSNVYKQNQITAASPKKLVTMLYSGCIKFLRLAELGLEENRLDRVNENIIKAQNIIQELRVTLNMDVEGEVAGQLASLYDYFLSELVQANIHKDKEKIMFVRNQMSELLEAWEVI